MNNSVGLELQSQLIEGDGDFVKGKIFIAQVVDVQSPTGGNPTEQKSKGDDSSIPQSGETESGVKIFTTTQYKIFICSLHSSELENEDLPWATPYWVNSNLGKTAIPSPRFEPGTFVFCFQDLKSRQWYIEAACPNQLEKLEGNPDERCKAFSGFAKTNAVVPESSTQGNRTGTNASSTVGGATNRVADGAETQNTVPTTADDKQKAAGEEELEIPQACKDAANTARFGLNSSITKLIKDIERFKADNPLMDAQTALSNLSGTINSAASTVTSYLASLVQEMKAFIMRKVSGSTQFVIGLLPQSKRYIANDAAYAKGGALDQINCLFQRILDSLLRNILNFLTKMISKLVNTAQCVVDGIISNFLGQLLGQIMGIINSILGQLGSKIGQVLSITNEVLDFVVSILELLTCEPKPQCAGMEKYNFLEGPNTTESFGVGDLFERAKGIMDSFSNLDFSINPDAFEFEFDADNAIKNTLDGCFAGPQPCGPPQLSLYGGQGGGGFFNAVLDEDGQLFGFDVVDPGEWTSVPNGKITDKCGNGNGGRTGPIVIGEIPQPDPEGSAPDNVARIEIVRQPRDINTKKKNKKVTFKVRAKIQPTDGKKLYRWYYSPDLGNNFLYIPKSNTNNLEVKIDETKDNYFYVCHIFDARKGLRKRERARSVKSDVVRLNLTDVTSAGDDDYENLEPQVTLKLNKEKITKNTTEKAKLSWTVTGKNIRDVRLIELRKYKKGTDKNVLYQKPNKRKAAKSGYIFVCPPVETQYKLIATNAYGTAVAKKTLKVKFIPNDCQFDIQQSLSKPTISDNGTDDARMFWKVKEKDQDATVFTVTGVSNPDKKGNVVLQPNATTSYEIELKNKMGNNTSSVELTVGEEYFFPINPSPGTPFFTNQAPFACASVDTYYIQRDGKDSAQLSCSADGRGLGIRSLRVRDLTKGKNLFNETYLGPSYPFSLDKVFTVQPEEDSKYELKVTTSIGDATSVIRLDTRKVRNCGKVVINDEPAPEEPGKPSDNCPPGFVYSPNEKKCVRKRIRDPWLPPPLFPPGIIQVPIIDPGRGYDPTLNGDAGGSGRVWKGKCEVGIQRVNGDWEVVGIGSDYKLYLGDTVYQPQRNPVTLGVPNGTPLNDKNVIKWENLTVKEIKKQIKGAEVFGTPTRIKDMSDFDDSRGAEIFKDVSMLDIKPIGIKGKRVAEGMYFDMTEFDDFQEIDVTFIAGASSQDEDNFHAVQIPQIGKFTEDSGRTIIKDIKGGYIYGPIDNKSRVAIFDIIQTEVETEVDAPGWNGPGIYYELLDFEDEAIDVDFKVIDSNEGSSNSITIPKNTFKDQRRESRERIETKRYAGGAIYGPVTSSGPGELVIGGNGVAFRAENDEIMLVLDDIGIVDFVYDDDDVPVIRVLKPAVVNFTFKTDDSSGTAGVAIKNIKVIDPFQGDAILAEFNYTAEKTEASAKNVTFKQSGIYPMEFTRPGINPDVGIQIVDDTDKKKKDDYDKDGRLPLADEGRRLRFRDNSGDDENAFLRISNVKKEDVEFMRIIASKGTFLEYDEAPQVKGTKKVPERGLVKLGATTKSRMYLETETPAGQEYNYGLEGIYDETDFGDNSGGKGYRRYYENTDSSQTLVVSTGLKAEKASLDMVLRVNRGVFKRYPRSVRMWRYDIEYKQAKDLGFSDQDIRWHLEHVFKSGTKPQYDQDNIIDYAMDLKLRDPNFGPLPQNFDNVKDMNSFDPRVVGGGKGEFAIGEPGFGYFLDYPYARSLGFSDADIRYYLTEVFLQKYPRGRIGTRMKAKLLDPTFGVFSYNPTFRVNVGRPNFFDCENDYPYAKSLGFSDVDIRFFLQYVYSGLVDKCMKKKLENPNWGRLPDFRVEVTSKGCPDPCEGVECPEGQVCKDGKCIPVDDPCVNTVCPEGFKATPDGRGGCECIPIDPSYPIIVTLCGVQIENPGFGYDCEKDIIEVTPSKGVEIKYTCNEGKLESIEVVKPGIGFTKIPTITIKTSTGKNAVLKPVFCFVEPEPEDKDPPDPCEGIICPEGEVCVDGKCVSPCKDNDDCPDGFICVNGKCVEVCTVDSDCPDGYICIDGKCVPDDPCAGVICPPGYICVDGVCVPDPCYGVVCPPGHTCIKGVCVPDKPPIPPDTPVVRVVDCVGKIDPGEGGPGGPGDGGPGGKEPYSKPKREVCN